MATFNSVFPPAGDPIQNVSLAATTATAAIQMGQNRIFALQASGGDIQILFGDSSVAAPTATTGWTVPSGATHQFDMGSSFTHIRIFNPGGSAIRYQIMFLSRT